MLLAVDTATRLAGLALYDPGKGQVLSEEMWHSANNHTVELMPRLVRMMQQQGLAPADLTGLVIGLGPGSFTGLRIGLGVAKGMAVAQRVPVGPRRHVDPTDLVVRPRAGRRDAAGAGKPAHAAPPEVGPPRRVVATACGDTPDTGESSARRPHRRGFR